MLLGRHPCSWERQGHRCSSCVLVCKREEMYLPVASLTDCHFPPVFPGPGCSALRSYGLATITPWGAIYSGALDWSAAQRKRIRPCSLPIATLSSLHTSSSEVRAGHSQADLDSDILQYCPCHLSTLNLLTNLSRHREQEHFAFLTSACPPQCLMNKTGVFVPRSKRASASTAPEQRQTQSD